MSNNAPDYENDLVFPPSMPRCDIEELKKEIDDLNTQGRETDVLIATIMKCQELVRKNVEFENENKRLKQYESLYHRSVGRIYELRALLKDCKEFFEECNPKDYTIMSERMDELLTKIEEALK